MGLVDRASAAGPRAPGDLDASPGGASPIAEVEEADLLSARPREEGVSLLQQAPKETQEALAAARSLLEVEPSPKGGTALWRQAHEDLRLAVVGLPDSSGKTELDELLKAMKDNFKAASKSTWRPQLCEALDILGEDQERLKDARRQRRKRVDSGK
eukprot:SRR837773.2786.p1 GENE.SRR837773.2786~~SRR837773.2786.p1  ORF type:complete len:164 (-),score=19.20 SRR837773.2786:25-492(-)